VKNKDQTVQLPRPSAGQGKLKQVAGSLSDDFNDVLINQVCNTLWLAHSDPAARDMQIRAACAALIGMKPSDETEGMLAAQMVATHSAAMECYRRAMLDAQTFEGRRENLNQANKLTRSYAALVEALNRHRGKGQQRVTVEHVHVHQGGQAIVGAVHQGGGAPRENQDQPHAQALTHEPGQTLPSEIEAVGEAVPGAGG
jgi:hypothetical protein